MCYGSYGSTTSCISMEVGRLFILPSTFMAVWYAMVAMDPFPPDIHKFADDGPGETLASKVVEQGGLFRVNARLMPP